MADERKPLPDEKFDGDDATLLRIARERYEKGIEADRDNRQEQLSDLEFLAGSGQWDDDVKQERAASRRPMLTINRMPQFVRQVVNDLRQNRIAIKVLPAGNDATEDMADMLSGLIRHIEAASVAGIAYINGGKNAASGGLGHFRIATEYADDDTFDQDIRIRPIFDPFAVVWDPDAVMLCREDARYCFVCEEMDWGVFKARYPDATLNNFDTDNPPNHIGDWATRERIRLAEYWVKKQTEAVLALTPDGRTIDVTEFDRDGNYYIDPDEAGALPFVPSRTRKVMVDKVESYLINGAEVLEGPWEFPSKYIPIIPVMGEDIHIGDRVIRHGVIRYAKDPQRMYNYWRSAQTEVVALQPKAPFLVTPEQVKGYEKLWKRANNETYPYLPFNPDPEMPGVMPQRSQPAVGSPAMHQEILLANEDMKATTGIYDAALGSKSNETSGRAIMARQQESDISTAAYADNLSYAVQHGGRVIVDLIPKIYDVQRQVRILQEDDATEFVMLNQTVQDPETGEEIVLNDVSMGKYDVTVSTGPSFTTRRVEAVNSMVELARAMPQVGALMMDILVRHMDWPGADELAERLKKALPPGVREPEEGEEPPQPTPEQMAAQQAGQLEQLEKESEAELTRAKRLKTEAETREIEAETMAKIMETMMQSGQMQDMLRQAAAMGAMDLMQELNRDAGVPAINTG